MSAVVASKKESFASTKKTNVAVRPSNIVGGGKGLFAKIDMKRGQTICLYSGELIHACDAPYSDPTYLVNFENGRGYKLIGDDHTGDVGHYANAIHPLNNEVEQNASFNFRGKRITNGGCRGVFRIVAKLDISEGDEIIVCYGSGYWLTMLKWSQAGGVAKKKKESTLRREERYKKRQRIAL